MTRRSSVQLLICFLVLVGLMLGALPWIANDRAAQKEDPMQKLVRDSSPARVVGIVVLLGGLFGMGLWAYGKLLGGLDETPAHRPEWGWGLVLTAGILMLGVPRLMPRSQPMLRLAVEGICGAAMLAAAVRAAGGLAAFGIQLRQPGRLAFRIPLFIVVLLLAHVFTTLMTAVVYQAHGLDVVAQDVASALERVRGTWRIYPIVALVLVGAPLFEECLYRGLLYGLLRERLPAGWAVGLCAVFFALVHDPVAMLSSFGAGVLFGLLRERTGTLLAPLSLHVTWNGLFLGLALSQVAG